MMSDIDKEVAATVLFDEVGVGTCRSHGSCRSSDRPLVARDDRRQAVGVHRDRVHAREKNT